MADAVESGGRARLVSELGRVQDLVRQLEQQLRLPADAASVDLCRRLVRQVVALTDRSMGMVQASPELASPLSGSPISSQGDGAATEHHSHPFHGASPKKRKATARWTSQQVRVSAAGGGSGAEGPADDGHSWRKYGQKDILGAKHPRAYYRCTHRNSQNCPATKQVQRTDDHPALFDVVYHGHHTCTPGGSGAKKAPQPQPQQHNPHAQAALQGLAARLTVATTATAANAAAAPALPPTTPESCPVRGGRLVAVVVRVARRLRLQRIPAPGRLAVPGALGLGRRSPGGGVVGVRRRLVGCYAHAGARRRIHVVRVLWVRPELRH